MPGGKKSSAQSKLSSYGFTFERTVPTVEEYLDSHPYREESGYLLNLKRKCCMNNKSLEDIKRLVEETRRKHVTNKTFGDHRPHHEMHINRVLARQERISHLMHRNECYEAVLEICKDLPEVDQAQWFSEMQQTFWGMRKDVSEYDLRWYMKKYMTCQRESLIYHAVESKWKRLFVCQNDDGTKRPVQFIILSCDEQEEEDPIGIPELLSTMVTDSGGAALIQNLPDNTAGVINVAVGSASPACGDRTVRIYASQIITESIKANHFSLEDIGEWEL